MEPLYCETGHAWLFIAEPVNIVTNIVPASRDERQCLLHNQTMTITTFREF